MNILGITTSSTETFFFLLSSKKEVPETVELSTKRFRYPKQVEDSKLIKEIFDITKALLKEIEVDRAYVLKSGSSPVGKVPVLKIKAIAIVELACEEMGINVEAMAPQTLRSKEKKIESKYGQTIEGLLNDGNLFSPQAYRDAALTALVGAMLNGY